MEDLTQNEWLLRNNESIFPQNTLRTPGVLSHGSNYLQFQISATMNAYHKAEREGFRLQDVNKAPLAQRRKKKNNSVDGRSESSDSSNSTHSSGSQVSSQSLTLSGTVTVDSPRDSPLRNLSNNSNQSNTSNTSSASYSSTHSTGFVPHRVSPTNLISSQQSDTVPQDIVVTHKDHSANQAPSVQEIRSSSESDGPSGKQPFQGYRGNKRKHSLEEESEEDYNEDSDSDYSGNECIIIDDEEDSDDSLNEALPSSLTEAVPRKKPRTDMGPIVIDD